MMEKFPNLTPSRVAALSCLMQYHEVHVRKKVPTEGFARPLAFGSAVHNVLQWVFDPARAAATHQPDVEALTRRAFARAGYPDAVQRDEDRNRCLATVTAYLASDHSDVDAATLGTEAFDELPTGMPTAHPLTLGAKYDRLLVRPGAPGVLVLKDYKTGQPGQVDLDGACIMLAIAHQRYKGKFEQMIVEYDYLAQVGLARRQVVSVAEAREVWKDLKLRASRVYNATEYPAEPGEHCMLCPLRKTCRPQLEAGLDELDELFE